MPLLDVVHERFATASRGFAADDLAAIYEVDLPAAAG
jgi:hypothetical protein